MENKATALGGNRDPKRISELRVAAVTDNLSQVAAFVEACLEAAECPLKTQMQIGVAVEEIFVNIAHYAYGPEGGSATVRVEADREKASATVTFMDSGVPYDPLAKEDPDIALPTQEREIGGLGIFMAKKLVDQVSYAYRDGKNVLRLEKRW